MRDDWFHDMEEAHARHLEDVALEQHHREQDARYAAMPVPDPVYDPDERVLDARGLKSAGTDDLEAWRAPSDEIPWSAA